MAHQIKIQTQSSADRITTSLSLAHQRKNKTNNNNNKTQHKSYTIRSSHKPMDQTQEGRNQKEEKFNLEAWEKETSSTVS